MQLSLVPLLNVYSIIGTYLYTKFLRIAFINPVVEKPGKHKLHFQLYKLNDVFKCILDLKIPEIFLSSVFVVCFAIQKWILSN